MSKYFKYLDLPQIPECLYKDIYESLLINPNTFKYPDASFYKVHLANKNLETFCRQFLPTAKIISVQMINEGMPMHKDIGRTEAINFLISAGGDNVYTTFYHDDLVETHKIEPLRWHWLNVSVFHKVIGLDGVNPRIAVTASF